MAFGNRLAGAAEGKEDAARNRGGSDYPAGAHEEEDVSATNARLKQSGGAVGQSLDNFLK